MKRYCIETCMQHTRIWDRERQKQVTYLIGVNAAHNEALGPVVDALNAMDERIKSLDEIVNQQGDALRDLVHESNRQRQQIDQLVRESDPDAWGMIRPEGM